MYFCLIFRSHRLIISLSPFPLIVLPAELISHESTWPTFNDVRYLFLRVVLSYLKLQFINDLVIELCHELSLGLSASKMPTTATISSFDLLAGISSHLFSSAQI